MCLWYTHLTCLGETKGISVDMTLYHATTRIVGVWLLTCNAREASQWPMIIHYQLSAWAHYRIGCQSTACHMPFNRAETARLGIFAPCPSPSILPSLSPLIADWPQTCSYTCNAQCAMRYHIGIRSHDRLTTRQN